MHSMSRTEFLRISTSLKNCDRTFPTWRQRRQKLYSNRSDTNHPLHRGAPRTANSDGAWSFKIEIWRRKFFQWRLSILLRRHLPSLLFVRRPNSAICPDLMRGHVEYWGLVRQTFPATGVFRASPGMPVADTPYPQTVIPSGEGNLIRSHCY